MRNIYFDVVCGASGDMLLSSLIDIGFPPEMLVETLCTLPVEPITLEVKKIQRGGISCTLIIPGFGNSAESRRLSDIIEILRKGSIPQSVYEKCVKVFDRLADAEARVHSIPKEQVHFHEIGALDTIVDILGVCMALDYFKIDKIFFSTLTDGHGTVNVAHGVLPVPVPATAVMIRGLRIKTIDIPTELLTPTGAALLTALGEQVSDTFEGKILGIGYGCGTKVFGDYPNYIRAILIEKEQIEPFPAEENVVMLESDMDHISGEVMGDVAGKLFDAGALDVSWIPLYMKKGRPGYRLSVIARDPDGMKMADIIIRHSRTLGVRIQTVRRITAQRTFSKTVFAGAECTEKRCIYKGYEFSKPEYEDLAALAQKKGCSLLDLMEEYIRNKK